MHCQQYYGRQELRAVRPGIVQLPRYMAEKHVADGSLVKVLSGWARVPVPVHAVFASTRYMTPKVRGFIDLCRDGFEADVETIR